MENIICAYNKTSDAGSDTSSFSVFMDKCNLCCPYCMNGNIINRKTNIDPEILNNLKRDVDKFKPKMIFISGGEPTERPFDLLNIIRLFRSWGCKIGLSTNGINTEILKMSVTEYCNIDYVSMDLKGDIDIYNNLGNSEYFMNVISSWLILRNEKKLREDFNYEIRTTLFPPFITLSVLENISKFFTSDEKWVLQQFRVVNNMPGDVAKHTIPYSENVIKKLIDFVVEKVPKVSVRYI